MKFRSDFVTNSSSSSFLVSFTATDNDGNRFGFSSDSFHGDEEFANLVYTETNEKGERQYYADCNPINDFMEAGMVESPEDVPDYLAERIGLSLEAGPINLAEWANMSAERRANLAADILGNAEDVEPDEFDDYDDNCDSEESIAVFESIKEKLKDAKEHFRNQMCVVWNNDSTPKSISVNMEYMGFGEMAPELDTMLQAVYGYNASDVRSYCDYDMDEAVDLLKAESWMSRVDDESIVKLVEFVQNFEYPGTVHFTQTLGEDGIVRYEIDTEL